MTLNRIAITATNPKIYTALVAVQKTVAAEFDPVLVELIKIRASQVNGCAYCVQMHVRDSIAMGLDPVKLALVATWRETSGYFTDRERAVLAFTDEVTRLGEHGVSDEVVAEAAKHFDAQGMGALLGNVVMINAWNRVAITSAYPVDEQG